MVLHEVSPSLAKPVLLAYVGSSAFHHVVAKDSNNVLVAMMTWIRSPSFEWGALGFWVALCGGLQSKI